MRNLIILILLNLLTLPCFAIEDTEKEPAETPVQKSVAKKFFDRKEIQFKDKFVNSIYGTIKFQGTAQLDRVEGNETATYPFNITGDFETLFGEKKWKFSTSYSFTREVTDADNKFLSRFTNLYIEKNLNKENKIRLGTSRAPIGIEGSMSIYDILLANKGQISRKFGDAMATGISLIGEKEAFEYNLGGYTSTRFTQGFKDGAEAIGRIGVKPFYKKDNPIKNLKFYAGTDVGHKNKNYYVHSAALDYSYKKFLLNAEYAYADGSNGWAPSANRAHGFFVTAGWNLSSKTQVLARYDYFDGDLRAKGAKRKEYTIGITHNLFKRVAVMLNYVLADDDKLKKPSHGIYFLTQFMI